MNFIVFNILSKSSVFFIAFFKVIAIIENYLLGFLFSLTSIYYLMWKIINFKKLIIITKYLNI